MRSIGTLALPLLLLGAPLAAQPTFSRIVLQDRVPLDLAPRARDVMSDGDVFVTRACLSPAARLRLAAGLGFDVLLTVDEHAPGPVILSANAMLRIPGDRRLRGELDSAIPLHVLGIGASAAESVAAARDEPMPRGILVGAHDDGEPPEGWRRVGERDARPIVWVRDVDVVTDRIEGERRALTILDDWPMHARDYGGFLAELHENPGLTQGPFPQHLQGIAADPERNLYWAWTDRLVKTDRRGKVLVSIEVPEHHGDLTWHDGHVAVATNHGKFNDPAHEHDSWMYVYRDDTLELVAKHALPECRYGAGGVCWALDRYVVVTGLPVELEHEPTASNEAHEYDCEFRHLRTVRIDGGWTRLGIQTAEFAHGRFFFGCYGEPRCALVASADLEHVHRVENMDCAYGIAQAPFGSLYIARNERREDGHHADLSLASPWWFGR